ncbi:MAG: hypothetical protein ACOX1S_11565 [Anaerostipes sp.]
MLYELGFAYFVDDDEQDEEVIAIYSTYQAAKKAIDKFKNQPRFLGHEDAFIISEIKLNFNYWPDGFSMNTDSGSPDYYKRIGSKYIFRLFKTCVEVSEIISEEKENVIWSGDIRRYLIADSYVVIQTSAMNEYILVDKENVKKYMDSEPEMKEIVNSCDGWIYV